MLGCRQSVVAVSGETQRARFLGELLIDTNEYNVVVVESVERGYARVKQEQPHVVIVYVAIDDPDRDVDRAPRRRRVRLLHY